MSDNERAMDRFRLSMAFFLPFFLSVFFPSVDSTVVLGSSMGRVEFSSSIFDQDRICLGGKSYSFFFVCGLSRLCIVFLPEFTLGFVAGIGVCGETFQVRHKLHKTNNKEMKMQQQMKMKMKMKTKNKKQKTNENEDNKNDVN